MTKRARKNRPVLEVVSSDPEVHPDATMGPDASLDTTGMTWQDRETSAPVVGEDEAPESAMIGFVPDRATREQSTWAHKTPYP